MQNSKAQKYTGGCIGSGYDISVQLFLSLLLCGDSLSCWFAPILLYHYSRIVQLPLNFWPGFCVCVCGYF